MVRNGGKRRVLFYSEDLLKAGLGANENLIKFAETFERFTVIDLQSERDTFDEVFQNVGNGRAGIQEL